MISLWARVWWYYYPEKDSKNDGLTLNNLLSDEQKTRIQKITDEYNPHDAVSKTEIISVDDIKSLKEANKHDHAEEKKETNKKSVTKSVKEKKPATKKAKSKPAAKKTKKVSKK